MHQCGHTAAASRVCRNSLELWWLKYIVVYVLFFVCFLGLAKQEAGKQKCYINDPSLFVQAKNPSDSLSGALFHPLFPLFFFFFLHFSGGSPYVLCPCSVLTMSAFRYTG